MFYIYILRSCISNIRNQFECSVDKLSGGPHTLLSTSLLTWHLV